jgi:hypothetical protein
VRKHPLFLFKTAADELSRLLGLGFHGEERGEGAKEGEGVRRSRQECRSYRGGVLRHPRKAMAGAVRSSDLPVAKPFLE